VKNEPGSTNITIPDLESIKARMKSTWMAGDFGRIAKLNEAAADEFIARRDLKPGLRVLDVACGTGNLAIPAARRGAVVTGWLAFRTKTAITAAEKKNGSSSKYWVVVRP
jgi:2-polyprenyl-3-methyl-5-hydroxy-6-metoxy-1,4-benzoquinol methylase